MYYPHAVHKLGVFRHAMAFAAVFALGCGSAAAQVWFQASDSGLERDRHAMAFDSGRGVVVLFGGANASLTTFHDETWEWDGTAWTYRTNTGPSERWGHAMAYDSANGRTYVFGGKDSTTVLGTLHSWNGSFWTSYSPSAPKPCARYMHAMVYDSSRGVLVLFGGYDGSSYFGDTWEFSGTTWTEKATGGTAGVDKPAARCKHQMAFDSDRGVTVLYGGKSSSFFDDTWEWNGTSWSKRTDGTPVGRSSLP